MRLRHALLLVLLSVLVASILPAWILLERRLGGALLDGVREEVGAAPMILKDRFASESTVRMMHARDFAAMPSLIQAFEDRDMEGATTALTEASRAVEERPVLIQSDGRTVVGPGPVPEALLEATRRGEMPVSLVSLEGALHIVALAPVEPADVWLGAVGGSNPFDEAEAAELAGLTRSDVVVVDASGRISASTAPEDVASLAVGATGTAPDSVYEITGAGERRLITAAVTLDEGRVVFVRDVDEALAVLPDLQRTALVSTAGALAFALLVGALFAHRLSRPVSEMADAAADFARGRQDVSLHPSALLEVQRLADAFSAMRDALAARLSDLETANRELEDRQERLAALQAELVQRERLATSGRVLAQLAHEIRNPVASVRNCLEVVRRQGDLKGEAREFADMAVSELLRMHELAERMLDLHRPSPEGGRCDAGAVARETAELLRAGSASPDEIAIETAGDLSARMPAEALKQVLLNLLLNAREASPPGGEVRVSAYRAEGDGDVVIDVTDRGHGIAPGLADRIFDPFFTTKDAVHGVGLGLYTAESLVRAAGGTLEANARDDGPGSRFTVRLPAVS